jgi:hypothetical protein
MCCMERGQHAVILCLIYTHMLGKVRESQSTVSNGMPFLRLQITRQQLDPKHPSTYRKQTFSLRLHGHSQGRFTTSVRTDNRDSAIQPHVNVDIFQNLLASRVAKVGFVQLQKWRRDLFRIGESVKRRVSKRDYDRFIGRPT